jgi:putative peptidoglycan lipid II flippase
VLRGVLSFGGFTLASRVLGFIRDLLMASVLGAGPVADAFLLAFRLPNHFRALFAEGAFNRAFVPTFTGVLVRDGRAEALRFAGQILTILAAIQLVLLVAALAFMPWVVAAMESADDATSDADLKVLLTRIAFPYLLFITVVALQGAVLNALQRYAASAAAPIVLNLCLIAAMLFLTPLMETAGHALAWGLLGSGLAQLLFLWLGLARAGVEIRMERPRWTPAARRFLRALGPVLLGAGIVQISLFADTVIAQLLPTGAQSYLYYADRLNQLPLGVIGIAVGVVLLPELSRALKAGDEAEARHLQNRSLEFALGVTLPAAIGLITLAGPIMALLYQRGAFTAETTALAAAALAGFAAGLPAYVLIKVFQPAYFARLDMRTPMWFSFAAVAVNIAASLILFPAMGHVGIAVATSISAWLNTLLLAGELWRRGDFRPSPATARRLCWMLLASLVMGAAVIGLSMAFDGWLGAAGFAPRALATFAIIAIAGAIYFGIVIASGALDRSQLVRLVRRRRPAASSPATP